MSFHAFERQLRATDAVTIRRLAAEGGLWRVRVQTWPSESGEFAGRIGFEPDGPAPSGTPRWCAATLHGPRREEMVAAAYDLTEFRLRRLLRSLA